MRGWSCIVLGAGLVIAGVAGCGGHAGKAFIVNRPDWPYDSYERLAVLPGQTGIELAGSEADVLSDRLTTLLTQNGQFKVLSRAELADVFKEQDLSHLADAVDQGTAVPEGQLEAAQAIVVTRITDYKLIADRKQQTVPIISIDRRGRPVQTGEEVITLFTHGAEVEGSVRVVDAATGRILVSHSARIAPKPHTGRNRPPSKSPEQVADEAVRDLAVEFYRQIAPTSVAVKFDKDNVLVATGYFDGRYDEIKKLPRDLDKFMVVVRNLSEECDRNDFKVAIAAAEARANLYESQPFTWSGANGPRGEVFEVPVSTLLDSGDQKFVVKLYSVGSPEPVVERSIELDKVNGKN